MRLPPPPLLIITDRRQATLSLTDLASAAAAGGCRWISVREKDLDGDDQAALFIRVAGAVQSRGVTVGIHGSPDLAQRVKADGVHLATGGSARDARRALGTEKLIGVSAHTLGEAARAADEGADYVTLSPIFPTASKPGYGPCIGIEAMAEVARRVAVPILALGGVDAGNVADCVTAGATGVAVMGEVMRADDPLECVSKLVAALLD